MVTARRAGREVSPRKGAGTKLVELRAPVSSPAVPSAPQHSEESA
jgi:hypothetical protein